MTDDHSPEPFRYPRLPWVAGAVALLVYALTFCPGITWENLSLTAQVAGWSGTPWLDRPVLWLLTRPVHWLPAAWVAPGLNLLSVTAAALTLGLLARCVQLLPLNRLRVQATFLHAGSAGWFNRRDAWLPAVVAVLGCGLEPDFWRAAVSHLGATLDGLLLAGAVWCLLEYRRSQQLRWLDAAVVIWGALLAENDTHIFLLPAFVIALLGFRGLTLYQLFDWLKFCLRSAGLMTLAFTVLFLVPPAVNWLGAGTGWTPGHALSLSARAWFHPVHLYFDFFGENKIELGIMLTVYYVVAILPLLIGLKREGSYHKSVQARTQLLVIQLFFTFCLGADLWLLLEPVAGPQAVLSETFNQAVPLLNLGWLVALGMGYLTAHFLLICGADIERLKRRNPQFRLPPFLPPGLRTTVHGLLYVLPVVLGLALAERSLGTVLALRQLPLDRFGRLAATSLPTGGGILFSDDPYRLELLQAALAGRADYRQWTLVDTTRLADPQYRAGLERHQPAGWTATAANRPLTPAETIRLVLHLATTKPFYYLHHSFGYYFEYLDQEPHGLVFKITPAHNANQPDLTPALIRENEQFWNAAWTNQLAALPAGLPPPPDKAAKGTIREKLFRLAPAPAYQDTDLAACFSISLDSWGVALQRAGQWTDARKRLEQALSLNPNNYSVRLSLQCNSNHCHGVNMTVAGSGALEQELQQRQRVAETVLRTSGPVDQPVMDFALGQFFESRGLTRQAVQYTERASLLAPRTTAPKLFLANLLARTGDPDRARGLIYQIRRDAAAHQLDDYHADDVTLAEANIWLATTNRAQGNHILSGLLQRRPGDENILYGVLNTYLAGGELTNALELIHGQLAAAPDDLSLLVNQARLEEKLGRFGAALATLNHALTLTNLPGWQLDRAGDRLMTGDLAGAAADYQQLKDYPAEPWRPYLGLAEVAIRRHDNATAQRNWQQALALAPSESRIRTLIQNRIRQTQTPPPK